MAYDDIVIAAQAQRVPVIMYHDVIRRRSAGSVWFDCTIDEFKAQMAWLAEHGAHPVSLDDLYAHLTTGKDLPDHAVVLTFDDNYQGYFDLAWPELKRLGYPSAMFVHTGFVGDVSHGRPKMSWTELKTLTADPLVTIGSHTVTHPAKLTELPPDQQRHELTDSKAALEKNLGKTINYLAYPDGDNDATIQDLSKACGYKMAFSVHNQPSEESPNIMCVGRYVQTRLETAWDACTKDVDGGVLGVFRHPITSGPVSFTEGRYAGTNLAIITGGTPSSILSVTRESVSDFIQRTPGAVAGINGGFFAMAAISSTDNRMVGPCKTADQPAVIPDREVSRWPKLLDRPMVIWGPREFAIAPYVPWQTLRPDAFANFMPDVSDIFLAGVWLVHGGLARTQSEMQTFASRDIVDPRRRAFLGMMSDGRIVIGASKDSCTSEQLANAISAAGIQEAVLLDSGFSTSLVYGEKVMASGHSTPEKPSRPVPHAIVLKGVLDPASAATASAAIPATDPIVVLATVHHHRHHKASPDGSSPAVSPNSAEQPSVTASVPDASVPLGPAAPGSTTTSPNPDVPKPTDTGGTSGPGSATTGGSTTTGATTGGTNGSTNSGTTSGTSTAGQTGGSTGPTSAGTTTGTATGTTTGKTGDKTPVKSPK